MSNPYTYSIASDFSGNLNPGQFKEIIDDDTEITTTLVNIDTNGDIVTINFSMDLPSQELTRLNVLIIDYIYGADPIATLISDGAYGTIATLSISQTENRTLTLPNITDNILSQNNTVTISGKTITTASNTFTKNYECIVDGSGNGDYTSISAAFAAGKSSVEIRNGIYYELNDIVLPDKGKLIGEANGQVVIVLTSSNSVKIDGSQGVKETVGTVSITNNSNIVTGVGTSFTNLLSGSYILIGNNFYPIISIANDTTLTLSDIYKGKDIVNEIYIAQQMLTGVTLENIIITSVSKLTPGLVIRGVRHFTARSVAVTNCKPNISIEDSGDSSFYTVISQNSAEHGIIIKNCYDFLCDTLNVFNNELNGLLLESANNCIVLQACTCNCNNKNGIEICGTTESVTINGCVCKQNKGMGVTSDNTVKEITIEGSMILNNDSSGIDFDSENNIIADSIISHNNGDGILACNKSMIHNNHCSKNIGHGINISMCNKCIVQGNTLDYNIGDGIYCGGDNIVFNTNICSNNVNGMNIINTASNNIVMGNQFINNTGQNYINNGVDIVSHYNIT